MDISNHNQPKAKMNSKDKKLLAFIIVGAILCVILGYVLVRMCATNSYSYYSNNVVAAVNYGTNLVTNCL